MIRRNEIACESCKKVKPMPALRSCKACRANYAKAHYRENYGYYIDKKDRWKIENRDQELQRMKAYRDRRGNRLRAEWNLKNPERRKVTNTNAAYKMRYGDFGPAKMVLNDLVRQLTGNPRSFAKV